jgi:protein phosphatase 1L
MWSNNFIFIYYKLINKMNVYFASMKGLRPQNEDYHEVFTNLDNKDGSKKNVNLYAVFDGHGGKKVSEYLKNNLPKYFTDKRVTYPISKKYVVTVYDHIQKSLQSLPFSQTSGSTALVAIHFKQDGDEYLNVLNSGDSRCVLCRDNFGMPLTKDHKPHWPEEYGRITQLGGKLTFDGFDYRIKDLSVSRAFGDLDATPFVTHRPDLFRYKLDKNDKFMVMACDGLWDVMSDSDVVNFVLSLCYDITTKKRINTQINIAKKLAEFAINKKKSSDNVSILVIFFN